MTKRLEIKKLFDQISTSSCRVIVPVEPKRYVVTDSFVVYVNEDVVYGMTIDTEKHTITVTFKHLGMPSEVIVFDYYDIVEYKLFKEI
jgi:hypothetical protein